MLDRRKLLDAVPAERDELRQLQIREGGLFAAPLHLDESPGPGHHDIHIDRRRGIFAIIQIQQRLAIDQADADRRDIRRERPAIRIGQFDRRQRVDQSDEIRR